MKLLLNGKVIIVSGGSGSVTGGIVNGLAGRGAIPVIIGPAEADNVKLVNRVRQAGGKAHQVAAELTGPGACKIPVEILMRHFGRIDGLVNNTGVCDGISPYHGSYEKLMIYLHSNIVHYYLLAHFYPHELKRAKNGVINSGPAMSGAVAAHNALTMQWAVELLKYDIRVNAVVVAEGHTPLYQSWLNSFPDPAAKIKEIVSRIPPGRRMATVQDMANSVALLLSASPCHPVAQQPQADGGCVHFNRAQLN